LQHHQHLTQTDLVFSPCVCTTQSVIWP